MLKKILLMMLGLLFCATAHAGVQNDITMLIVPRDAKTIQIAQDIAGAYPVLLVVYRQTGSVLDLHAWNGESWVPVSVEDYTNGAFFATAPTHAILVHPGRVSVPDVLIPSGAWCQSGNRLLSTDPRVLIHLLGRYFNFPYRHWKELADRYGYTFEQVNPGLINVHWWHYRGDVLLDKRAQRDPKADLDQWYGLEITPPPAPEPVAVEEEMSVPPADVSTNSSADAAAQAEIPVKAEEPGAVEKTGLKSDPATAEPADVSAATAAEKIKTEKPVPVETPMVPAKETVEKVPEVHAEPAPLPEASEATIQTDPFSGEEIPSAEVVLPKKAD